MSTDPEQAGARSRAEPVDEAAPDAAVPPPEAQPGPPPQPGPRRNPGDAPTRLRTLSIHTASAWGRTTWTGDVEDEASYARLRNVRLRLLGQGGQGQVYLVEHLGQLEAHKFLDRPGADKSIFREALHTRLVDHPNIVKVFGTEEVEGAAVLRMEYVDGRDLARVVDEDGILPVARLVPLAAQVAEALAAAHEAGIVHQDLKPSNLILDEKSERLVVTDFGVSAALRTSEESTGARGGTPIFMSPELLAGHAGATPRSDVWSLGVTLYYLATGTYPFPFDALPPLEAVSEPPRDPRPDAPHIPAPFWRLLERMLESDPERAYGTMAEVRRDLVLLAETVACPACAERVPLDPEAPACPRCGSTQLPAWIRAARARREAETALALCSFSEAETAARAAAAIARELGREDDARAAAALARAAAERGRASERELDALAADLEARRWVEAVARLAEARRLFSRSPRLAVLRSRLREGLRALHERTEPRVTAALRRGAFDEARTELERLRQVLDDDRARAAVERALGRAPEDPAWLEEEIRRKEARFRQLSDETESAIAQFEFDRALVCLARREDEFPAEESVDLMSRLRRARDDLARARRYAPEELEELAREPLASRAGERLELVAAVAACRRILADFPVESYPSFEQISSLERRLERATTAVHETVQEHLDRAREAEKARLLGTALQELDSVQERVLESDLFGASTREELLRMRARLTEVSERASNLWRDGMRARDRREYAQALLALREVARLAPQDYPDARRLQAEVETVRDRAASLSEQVARELAEIRRGRFTPESACLALENVEALWKLSDDDRRERLDGELGEALRILLASQREHLALSGGAGAGEATAFLLEALVPLCSALSPERFLAAVAREPRVGEDLAALGAAGFRDEGAELDERLDAIRARLTALEPVAALFSGVTPTTIAPTGRALGERVFESFRRAARPARKRGLAAATALMADLLVLIPAQEHEAHRRMTDRLRRMGTRAVWARVAQRSLRLLVLLTPLLGVAAAGWVLGRESGVDARERERNARLEGWVGMLGLPPLAHFQAQRWLAASPGPERIALLRDWADLRRDAEGAGRWSALALLGRRSLVSERAGPELLEAFDADLAAALERAAASAIGEARADLAGRRHAGSAEALALAGRLEPLQQALAAEHPAGGPLAGLEDALGELAREAAAAADADGAALGRDFAALLPERIEESARDRSDLGQVPLPESTGASRIGRGPGPPSSGRATLSAATREGFAAWREALFARVLTARLDQLTERAMLGRVDGFVEESAALVGALAPLVAAGFRPPPGRGASEQAVDAALRALAAE